MKSIKEIWYRKQIATHEERVERTRASCENAHKFSWVTFLDCQEMRRAFAEFPFLGEASVKRTRKDVVQAIDWVAERRADAEDAHREYKAFRERVGLD